jgi:hypothetical protein
MGIQLHNDPERRGHLLTTKMITPLPPELIILVVNK